MSGAMALSPPPARGPPIGVSALTQAITAFCMQPEERACLVKLLSRLPACDGMDSAITLERI